MHNSGAKIYIMHASNVSAFIPLPLRHSARSSSGVLAMPPRTFKPSNVVTLIADAGSSRLHAPARPSALRTGVKTLSRGVRMTLVALFALLGWPRPSRDNDPGPSAARPCHWERTNLISHLHLPGNEARTPAAHRNLLSFDGRDAASKDEALAA